MRAPTALPPPRSPEVRGAGLTTRLLTGLVADASRAGVPVRLTVARDNDARRLCARLGFAAGSGERR
jgi:predicted GNAT family acetyltransferase